MSIGGTTLEKAGTSSFEWSDPYHLAMTARWPAFFLGLSGIFVLVNLVFAVLYTLQPNAITSAEPGSLRDAFFFSMETLATVGYGTMAPATTYGHVLSAIEIVCGLAFTAIMTGLIFVRFSKVKPKMLFADKMVVCMHDGKPTLMLRIAYGRSGMLMSCSAKIHVLVPTKTSEGRTFRMQTQLPLVRAETPLLVLTWTIMHVIDEQSPLWGVDAQKAIADDMRSIVTFEARDHSLSSAIHDVHTYSPADLKFGMVYEDIVTTGADKSIVADVRRISDVKPE